MYVDLFRHYALYCAAELSAGNLGEIPAYNLVPGQTAAPFLMGYEASIETVIPTGVSTTNWAIRGYMTHDFYFHPYFADAEDAFHLGVQSGGVSLATAFDLTQPRATSFDASTTIQGVADTVGGILWGHTTWAGMSWGRGDGTLDGNGVATVNLFFNGTGQAQDLNNVSPKLQGWRDWVSVANAIPVQPSSPARPLRWFPGLDRSRI